MAVRLTPWTYPWCVGNDILDPVPAVLDLMLPREVVTMINDGASTGLKL